MNPICTAEKVVNEQPEETVEPEPSREEVVEQLEMCLEKRGSLQDKCISDHAIKPYLLKGQYNLD